MPRIDDKKKGKKLARRRKSTSDEDISVDSKGNVRNLIDYDYSETSNDEMFEIEETPRAPRKAKLAAKKKIRREAGLSSVSSDTPKKSRAKPVLVVESEEESEESEKSEESEEEKKPRKKAVQKRPVKVEKKKK